MSQQQIQILHVDDEPDFADLTGAALRNEDDRFVVETATSAEEGLNKINECQPDCVVSDYNMPGTDGLEFLQAVRAAYPDLPFILFTGRGSEEVAADAISTGATDYLQKQSGTDQFRLLANRILNAVTQYRSERRLSETRKQYTSVFENAQNALLLVDIEDDGFRYQQCNPKAIELIGRDRTEIVGKRPSEALGPENGRKVVGAYRKCVRQRESVAYTVALDLPMGRVIRASEVTPVSSDGQIEELVVEFRDVTDQRKRQRDLEKVETLFQHAQDSLFLVDVSDDFTVERVNPAYEDATGVSASEIQGQTPVQVLGEEQGTAVEAKYRECVKRQEPRQYTEQLHFGSEPTYWETRIAPVVIEEKVEYIAGSTRNVTEQKERWQELDKYETIIEALTDSVYVLDEERRFTYVNDEFVELVGYDRETILGNAPTLIKDEEAVTRAEQELGRLLSSDGPDTAAFEVTVHPREGDPIVCEDHMGVLPYEGEQFNGSVGTLRDITGRKEREQQLSRERQRYTRLFETLPNPVVHARLEDGEPVVQTVNPAFEDTFGYEAETIRDEPLYDYILPDGQADADPQLKQQVLTEGGVQTEVQRKTTDGVRTFRVNITLRNTETEDTQGYAVYTDITERKEREQELDRQNDLFARSQDIANVGAWEYNPKEGEAYFTDMVYEIYGVGPDYDPAPEQDIRKFYHPDDRDTVRTAIEKALQSRKEYDIEVRITAADGTDKWIRTRGTPEIEDGTVQCVRGTIQDITDHKEREQELQDLKSQYEILVENFPDGAVFLMDTDLTYVRTGGEELNKVGLSPDDFEGRKPHALFPEEIADELYHYYEEALDRNANTFEQVYGGKRYRIQTVPVRTDDEEIEYVMAVSQNITERAEDKRVLEHQNERLEEFTSIVSHDLRNPLQVANGRLELIREECESDHVDDVARALDRMDALIEDLLTLARGGEQVDETEPVGLANVAENSWQTVNTEQAVLETDSSRVVKADQSRLRQLFENLYRNAVEHGGDDVTVSVGAMDGGFYVADTGPGIPKSDREEIFEAGYSTNEQGTGFGLRIVGQIADAHGWGVTVTESGQGGARFEVTGVETAE